MCACGGEGSCFGRVDGFSRRQRSVTGLSNHSHLRDIPAQWREYQFHVRFRAHGEPGSFGREKERDMSMLERLSDARGTLEGKIVAVILAVLLVLPVASVTAFAGGHDHESDAAGNTEEVQMVSEELPDTGSVVLDETPAPEEEVPGSDVPETEVPGDPTEPEAPGVPAAPEPEDPPASDPAEDPTETEEPEATTVEIQLKIDEGATLKFEDDTFYTEDDTKMELTSDQEKEFTIEMDEGYELAVEKPVVFKDVADIEEELEAVDGKYTFPTNVMDGGKLTIAVNMSLTAAPEEDAIAPVAEEDDGWVAPASPQSITAKNWCTNKSLGSTTRNTGEELYSALGTEAGIDPKHFAEGEYTNNGTKYVFHHAQVQPVGNQQTDKAEDNKYDYTIAIQSIRFNQSLATPGWEYKGSDKQWKSMEGQQLVLYYHMAKPIGEGNTSFTGSDWPYTEQEWIGGEGDARTSCVIYQIYDESGKKIGEPIRTFYYSPDANKNNCSISIAEYWSVEEVKIQNLQFKKTDVNPSNKNDRNHSKVFDYVTPDTFIDGPSVDDPNLFVIPWETWNHGVLDIKVGVNGVTKENLQRKRAEYLETLPGSTYACLVAVKVKALPSEASLAVEYLDADITDHDVRIHDPESVPANKPNGTPDPTWNDYVSFDGDKLVGDPDSVEIVTNISNSTKKEVPFKIDVEGYASKPVRAVLDGNTLKLYYNPVYTVGYSWSGVSDTAVLASGNAVKVPTGTTDKGVASGFKFNVDSVYTNETRAYVMVDGKVSEVYQFSGWKQGNNPVKPGDEVTVGKANILFTGEWKELTYTPPIKADGKIYDGNRIENHVTVTEELPDGYGEPNSYQYRASDQEEWSDTAPVDAGSYVVRAVWNATDWNAANMHPEVVSNQATFEISQRAVNLLSASATKTFDGKELKAERMETMEGFVEGEGIDITYTGARTNEGVSPNTYTFTAKQGTNLDNYKIPDGAGTVVDGVGVCTGTLTITDRDIADRIPVKLVAKSSTGNTYNGTEVTVSGLDAITVTSDGAEVAGNADTSSFVYGDNTYTVTNYTASAARTNFGTQPVNIATPEDQTFKVMDGTTDVTRQFNVTWEPGTLSIDKRSVTLASESATKVYDGSALTAPIEGTVDEVLAAEANVEAAGSVTNVADSPRMNTIAVTPKAESELDEGINEYNENNYAFTKVEGTLTITPQSITKDPQNPDAYKGIQVGGLADEQYNGTKWEKTPEVTPAANSVNETITFDVARTDDLTNVGTKTVTITGKGNYTGTVTLTFDVTPAPVVIVVNSASKVYGQDDPTFEGTTSVITNIAKNDDGTWARMELDAYETRSLFTNDLNNNKEDSAGNFTYVRSNADVQNVGTYKNVLTTSFDAANADAVKTAINANYSLVEVIPGNFSITQATATLNATGVTTTYDANEYAISVAPMGEEGWTVEYATTPNGPWGENPVYTEAGQYPVYVKATNPNYVDVYGTATVTINPAPVTIRVNDATKVAGSENPEFTGTIEGEVAGHELTGVSYYRKSDAEGIGTYENDLTASYDDNPNYIITVEDGDFTITAMPVPAEPVTPPTTPAPGPLDGIVTTVTDFLATPIIGAPAVAETTAIDDAENPLAQIEDDGTPMSAFDAPICWIHYYILLGIIITAIYGGGVIARRLGYSHKVKSYEDDVTGKEKKRDKVKDPAPNPAQPTI